MSGLHVYAGNMNSQWMNTIASSEDLNSQINSLNSNVENLMTIWRGLSANQFKMVVDDQIVNLRDFQEFLNLLGQKITQGARQFDDTEQENANRAAGLF